jgi:hypothetical protein
MVMSVNYKRVILVFVFLICTYIAYANMQVAKNEALDVQHKGMIIAVVENLNKDLVKDCIETIQFVREGSFVKPNNLISKVLEDKLYTHGDYEYSDFTVEFSIKETKQKFRLYSLIKNNKCFGIFEKL